MTEMLHRRMSGSALELGPISDERTILLHRQRSQSMSLQPISEHTYISFELEDFPIRFQGKALLENKALLTALSEDLQLVRDVYMPSSVWKTLKDYDVKLYLHEGIPGFSDRDCGCLEGKEKDSTVDAAAEAVLRAGVLEPFEEVDCCHFSQCCKDDVNHNRNLKMAGHIEIIVDDYLAQRQKWGAGGLLLHEFAHAFDFHCLSTEHSARLREIYERTLGYYTDKNIYAGMNMGEFFAELSVAYLGNTVEVNKVFPRTIDEIDPESRALLKEIWTSRDEEVWDIDSVKASAGANAATH